MSYDAIEDAFNYISEGPPGDRKAMIQRSTGKVLLASVEAGFDQMPPDANSDPDYLLIPSRQDLDSGKGLMLEFFHNHARSEVPQVEAIFARSGAFRKVKDLMHRLQLLDLWYLYDDTAVPQLIRNPLHVLQQQAYMLFYER